MDSSDGFLHTSESCIFSRSDNPTSSPVSRTNMSSSFATRCMSSFVFMSKALSLCHTSSCSFSSWRMAFSRSKYPSGVKTSGLTEISFPSTTRGPPTFKLLGISSACSSFMYRLPPTVRLSGNFSIFEYCIHKPPSTVRLFGNSLIFVPFKSKSPLTVKLFGSLSILGLSSSHRLPLTVRLSGKLLI